VKSPPVIESLQRSQRFAKEAMRAPTTTAVARLIRQAFDAARQCGEPYHAALAATWPLKVLRIKGHDRALTARTGEILEVLEELNCVSRLWLLSYVVGATCGGPKDLFTAVVRRFIAEARLCRSWQTPRLADRVMVAAETVDSRLADDVLSIFETPKAQQRAVRFLAQVRAAAPAVEDVGWPSLG
jgi:hypothetical protein